MADTALWEQLYLIVTVALGATVMPSPSAAVTFTFVPVTVAYAIVIPFLA